MQRPGVGQRARIDVGTPSAYLFVDDADDLAAAWRSAGVEVHSPQDTDAALKSADRERARWSST